MSYHFLFTSCHIFKSEGGGGKGREGDDDANVLLPNIDASVIATLHLGCFSGMQSEKEGMVMLTHLQMVPSGGFKVVTKFILWARGLTLTSIPAAHGRSHVYENAAT